MIWANCHLFSIIFQVSFGSDRPRPSVIHGRGSQRMAGSVSNESKRRFIREYGKGTSRYYEKFNSHKVGSTSPNEINAF